MGKEVSVLGQHDCINEQGGDLFQRNSLSEGLTPAGSRNDRQDLGLDDNVLHILQGTHQMDRSNTVGVHGEADRTAYDPLSLDGAVLEMNVKTGRRLSPLSHIGNRSGTLAVTQPS